jgi:hypothetical protein
LLSSISAAQLSTYVTYAGLFNISTGGTIQLQAFASSGDTNQLTILPGSYITVFKLG